MFDGRVSFSLTGACHAFLCYIALSFGLSLANSFNFESEHTTVRPTVCVEMYYIGAITRYTSLFLLSQEIVEISLNGAIHSLWSCIVNCQSYVQLKIVQCGIERREVECIQKASR